MLTPAEKYLQHFSIYVNYRLRSVEKIAQRCQRKFRLEKLIELPRVSFGNGETPTHRVGRVLSFSPVVGIGTPPTPHPFGSGGRDTFAGERGDGRVPIPTRGHTLWYSLYLCTLPCAGTNPVATRCSENGLVREER